MRLVMRPRAQRVRSRRGLWGRGTHQVSCAAHVARAVGGPAGREARRRGELAARPARAMWLRAHVWHARPHRRRPCGREGQGAAVAQGRAERQAPLGAWRGCRARAPEQPVPVAARGREARHPQSAAGTLTRRCADASPHLETSRPMGEMASPPPTCDGVRIDVDQGLGRLVRDGGETRWPGRRRRT